jgi:hypothetical protein
MPTPTYIPLQTITLGSAASSVTFAIIPATYRDLVLVVSGSVSVAVGVDSAYNGDTGNKSRVIMYGSGSSAVSDPFTDSEVIYLGSTQSTAIIQIMDYSATDKHKTILARADAPSNTTMAIAQRWASTAAINSVALSPKSARTFSVGTTFSLYAIEA